MYLQHQHFGIWPLSRLDGRVRQAYADKPTGTVKDKPHPAYLDLQLRTWAASQNWVTLIVAPAMDALSKNRIMRETDNILMHAAPMASVNDSDTVSGDC